MRIRIAIAVLAVAGFAGCGGGDGDPTIPQENGDNLLEALSQVDTSVQEGDCTAAETNASQFGELVNLLPASVDREVKSALQEAAQKLTELASQDCEETGTTGEQGVTETDPVEEAPVEVAPVEPAAPPEEDEETSELPPGQGGEPPGQGGVPPGQSDGDNGGVGEEKGKAKGHRKHGDKDEKR